MRYGKLSRSVVILKHALEAQMKYLFLYKYPAQSIKAGGVVGVAGNLGPGILISCSVARADLVV